MPIIDKGDFTTGFWVGLGLILAFTVVSLAQYAVYRARSRNG
jgi:hypothetical protein